MWVLTGTVEDDDERMLNERHVEELVAMDLFWAKENRKSAGQAHT